MSQIFDDATRAYMAGQKAEAQTLLAQALRANPRDEAAWLLLERCVDPIDRKKYCLQQVILINPNNPEARQRLADLAKPAAPVPQPPLAPTQPLPPSKPPTSPLSGPLKKPPTSPLAEPSKPPTRPLPEREPPVIVVTPPYTPVQSPPVVPPPPPPPFSVSPTEETLVSDRLKFEDPPAEPESSFAPPEPSFTVPAPATLPPPPPPIVPPVTSMEASLMDEESFKPAPFAAEEDITETVVEQPSPTPAPTVSTQSNSDFSSLWPDTESASPTPAMSLDDTFVSVPDSSVETTMVSDMGADTIMEAAPIPEPPAAPPPPAQPKARPPDKAALRARLEEAVTSLERGNKPDGIIKLESLLKDDPRNEMAYMWLGAAVDDDMRKRECYLRALELNPKNKMAQDRLAAVETKLTEAGVALAPLEAPLPSPVTTAPPSSGALWIGIFITLFILVAIGAVAAWVLTHR